VGTTLIKHQRTSFPETPNAEPRQPTAREQPTPLTATHQDRKRSTISEADVRLRAYELYLKRGGAPGNDMEDWLQAERELRAN